MIELPITDTFDDAEGRFPNYTAYDITALEQLAEQKHIDIRNSRSGDWRRTYRGLVLGYGPQLYWPLDDTPGSYSATVLADTPALYWRLGETVGTTAADASGNGRVGTYAGTFTLNQAGGLTGDANPAVDLDGTTGVITSTYFPWVTGSSLTFMGLAWRDTNGSIDALMGGTTGSGSNNRPTLTLASGNQNVTWQPTEGAGGVTWTAAWPGNAQWVHWAMTYNDATGVAELFINGFSKGKLTSPNLYVTTTANVEIGANRGSPGLNNFDGKLDEFAIIPGILKPERIRQYVEKAGKFLDFSGNGRIGTPTGTVLPNDPSLVDDGGYAVGFLPANSPTIDSSYDPSSADRTFTGWGRLDTASGEFGLFSSIGETTQTSNIYLNLAPNGNGFDFRPNGTVASQNWGVSNIVAIGARFHWAVTWNNTTGVAELWIDGVSKGIRTFAGQTLNSSATPIRLGLARLSNVSRYWRGALDEFSIHTGVLSPAHIKALNRMGRSQTYVPVDAKTIPNMQGWYQPESLSQFGADVASGQWNDTSGNNRHATEATDKPLNRLNQVRGYPALDFDGTNDKLTASGFPTGSVWTVFAVVRGTTNRYLSSGATLRLGWAGDQPNNSDGVTLSGGPTGFGTTYKKVVTSVFNGASSAIRFNGIQVATGDAGSTASASTWLIGVGAGTQWWNGEVVEVLIYQGTVSTSNMEAIEEYLMNKFGVVPSPGAVALPTHNFWRAEELSITTPGANYLSVVRDRDGEVVRLDLSTDFDDNDEIVVSLPTFPLSSLNIDDCWIDFTTDSHGRFEAASPVASIRFADYAAGLTTGNSELRFPRSALTGINLALITGVRFRFAATAATTVYVGAVRLFSTDWLYGTVDIDTLSQELVPPMHPAADPIAAPAFIVPRVWRAADPPSADDPRPIDASIGVLFNSGRATGTNRFTIYFREQVADYLTQLDLNGMTQMQLEGMNIQPDTGDGKWDPRDISSLEGLTMESLEGTTMEDLERIEDFDLSSWFAINVQWGNDRAIISGNAEENGVSFEDIAPLALDTRYLALLDVEEDSFQVRLYPVTANGVVQYGSLLYDTGHIVDDFLVKRRKGRIGWEIDMDDGSAHIEEIRTRFLNFAEYRSQPFVSHTPVEGAQLFAEFSPDDELVTTVADGRTGGFVTVDTNKSLSGQSYRINNNGSQQDAGARTNVIEFENFDDYQIELDVWYPQWALDAGNFLKLYLIDDFQNMIALNFGNLTGDTWVHRSLTPVEGNAALTGRYYLSFEQPTPGLATEWWLDNVHVRRRSVRWEARSQVDDPWGDTPAQWTNFRDKVNNEHDGILFPERDKSLQVRGKALRQNVTLGQVQVVPKYAELGRPTFESFESLQNLAGALPSMPQTSHTVDFGVNKKLDRVYVVWNPPPAKIQFLGSTDNVTYQPILTADPGFGRDAFVFASQPTYRYLRMTHPTGASFTFSEYTIRPALLPPTAAFTTSAAGFTITFDGSTSTDPDGRIVSYVWNFGDGGIGYGRNIKHTYVAAGSYPATLTVIDDNGLTNQVTNVIGV